jgi:hypothetical protein
VELESWSDVREALMRGTPARATGGGRATVHIMVEDVTATRSTLRNAGLEVGDEREVIVVDV